MHRQNINTIIKPQSIINRTTTSRKSLLPLSFYHYHIKNNKDSSPLFDPLSSTIITFKRNKMSDVHIRHRTDYKSSGIPDPSPENPNPIPTNPFDLFSIWFEQARETEKEPEAVCLSTSTKEGVPSSRMVLLRDFFDTSDTNQGFVFYTNYDSRKGQELKENPNASLCFYWPTQRRSVRVVGTTSIVPTEMTQSYFETRPLESRLGAYASPQSQHIPNRAYLENRLRDVRQELIEQQREEADGQIKSNNADNTTTTTNNNNNDKKLDKSLLNAPPYWGGIHIHPYEVEFWAGQPSRLHDRFVYRRNRNDPPDSPWTIQRLAP